MAIWDSFGGIGGSVMSWITTTAFWVLLIFILLFVVLMFLIIRKSRKFDKIILEKIDLGDGRQDYKITKGGWFKSRFTLGGLWDYGSESRFRLKDMSLVDNVSQNDYRRINGKLGLVVVRNPHDPKIVFPINREFISRHSKAMMSEVAPADYRDAAEKAIEQVDQEMQSKWQQYAPLIIIGLVVMISLIITILNTQYGKYMVDKAIAVIQEIKSTPCGAIASTIAP